MFLDTNSPDPGHVLAVASPVYIPPAHPQASGHTTDTALPLEVKCPLASANALDINENTTTKEHTMTATTEVSIENPILTIDQAAAYLGIPKATLYTWRTRRVGFGPRAIKIGGCLRYRRSELDNWIDRHLEPDYDNHDE
jgi:excisionase family DNA binding protein